MVTFIFHLIFNLSITSKLINLNTQHNMKQTDIKTIDLQAKEWFDRVNGNSYFSALATINFGMENEKRVYIPFQYGYGDYYQFAAFSQLQKDGILNDETIYSPTRWARENNIIFRYSKQENCRQRDVKAWGSN